MSATLYHHPYSVCSIMVRYTLAIRGPPKDKAAAISVQERVIDIFHQEQLKEDFLCNINPLGQVPVLVSANVEKPIADSLEITYYLSESYPQLMPETQKSQIKSLLGDLHALNYFSLSFPGREQVATGFVATVEERLRGIISERYRKALEFKKGVLLRDKVGGLNPEVTAAMSDRAQKLMQQFASLLSDQGPWLFGLQTPTALDAHLVTFIQRMRDVNRGSLIPEKLGEYADKATSTTEWKAVMEGRRTMIAKSS